MTAAIKEFWHKVVVNFVVKCAVKMEFLRLIHNQIEANATTHKNQQSIDKQRKSRSFNNYGICHILERMTGIEPALRSRRALINQAFLDVVVNFVVKS